jgi:hypothetical protein
MSGTTFEKNSFFSSMLSSSIDLLKFSNLVFAMLHLSFRPQNPDRPVIIIENPGSNITINYPLKSQADRGNVYGVWTRAGGVPARRKGSGRAEDTLIFQAHDPFFSTEEDKRRRSL